MQLAAREKMGINATNNAKGDAKTNERARNLQQGYIRFFKTPKEKSNRKRREREKMWGEVKGKEGLYKKKAR